MTSKEIVAVKVLKQGHSLRDFEREANILKSLNHPNIVRFVEYNKNNGNPYLVMEYARYGTLRQSPPKAIKQVVEYVDQIANALDYLHNYPHEIEGGKGLALPLMHLDLKPGNVLLGEGPDGKRRSNSLMWVSLKRCAIQDLNQLIGRVLTHTWPLSTELGTLAFIAICMRLRLWSMNG